MSRFITLEGGEGSGKSTQSHLLAARLRARGFDVLETREPGGSPMAELIRRVILSGAAEPLGAATETLMFYAARDDHLQTVIRPALRRGTWVICDRFVDSTRAYQEHAGQVAPELIRALERVVIGETWPDLTIILDIDPEQGLARAATRNPDGADRYERADIAFHRTIRRAFRAIAEGEPERCVLIGADEAPETIGEAVWAAVTERLGLRVEV